MRGAEQAMLLLCCALGGTGKPLTLAEFRTLQQRVSGLDTEDGAQELRPEHLRQLGYSREMGERIVSLLAREEALHRYLQIAAEDGVCVLTRISQGFPQSLRKLGESCPPALFYKGDPKLFGKPCVALVGSRQIAKRNRDFAARIGELAAREGYVLISGGAAGADSVAQEACLGEGGQVICIVPDELRRHPMRERVLYCCEEGYELPFTAARALRRNRLIHGLGEKTFVAQTACGQGGTWAGTKDNLRRGLSPVFILDDGSEGAAELVSLGAVPVDEKPESLHKLTQGQLSIFD